MNLIRLVSIIAAACLLAQAATLSGKVTPGKAVSAVYVEAIAGKVVRGRPLLIDQKGALSATSSGRRSAGTKNEPQMGRSPSDRGGNFKYDASGVVPLLCNVYPEISAYVVVARNAFTDGAFLNAISEAGLASSIAHIGPPLNKSADVPPYGATLTKTQIETLIDYTRAVAIRRTDRRV